jgi:hypothetical protein
MSSADNPYVTPNIVPSGKGYRAGTRKLQVSEMFQWVFTNPNWMVNVMWGGLCMLLSSFIVPQMVFAGYLWECMEKLHKKETNAYPDFDMNRFGDYLQRGVWPLLVNLVVMLPLVFILWFAMMIGGLIVGLIGAQLGDAGAIVGTIVMFIAFFVLIISLNLVMMPLMLRAGLSQDFATSFDFNWIKDFIVLTWKELALGTLVLIGASLVYYFVGLALCCIGLYATMAMLMYTITHFQWQLYEIFLDRGGKPIPLKVKQPLMVNPPPPQQY